MNHIQFKFKATVDWVELEVHTINPHPAWRVWKAAAGAFSRVTGLDPHSDNDIKHTGAQGENTPTTRFATRIQAPERFTAITAALNTIRDLCPVTPVTVRSIEVAFDAYRQPGTTDAELVEMVVTMLHQINRPSGTNDAPRVYKQKGTPELRYGLKALRVPIQNGNTAMYGNKGDDFVVRGYLKDYDTVTSSDGGTQRVNLSNPSDYRARIEVRLQGRACPVRSLNELNSFRFESLARFFKFRQLSDNLTDLTALVAERSASLGSVINTTGQKNEAYRNRGRLRKTKVASQASPLNERARDQLRKLTRRWSYIDNRRKAEDYENSGGSAVETSAQSALEFSNSEQPKALGMIRQSNESAAVPNAPPETPAESQVLNTSSPVTSSHLPSPKAAQPLTTPTSIRDAGLSNV